MKSIYQGSVIKLYLERVRLPNGQNIELEIMRHPGASAVVPLMDQNHVLLIRQYRHAVQQFLYEVPAGKLSPGESPLKCARRELEEETGYRAGRLKKLGAIFTSPGFCDERIHLYLATDLVKTQQCLEPCEVIELRKVHCKKVTNMIRRGQIQDAKSIVALALAGLY